MAEMIELQQINKERRYLPENRFLDGMDFCCQIPPAGCFNNKRKQFQDNFKSEKDGCFIKER